MTRLPADITVQKDSLRGLKKIAKGQQGTVYRVDSVPTVPGLSGEIVYKSYSRTTLAEGGRSLRHAMPQLILLPDGMSDADQTKIRRHTVWPQALVIEGDEAVGILMRLIPDGFFFDLQKTAKKERTLLKSTYMLVPEVKKLERNIPPATAVERLIFLLSALDIVAFFHRHSLIIGDFSANNLIASNPDGMASPGKRLFVPKFMDIDGFRFGSTGAPIQQLNSPAWFTPETTAAIKERDRLIAAGAPAVQVSGARAKANIQTTKSDVFKMGLLALRLFHVAPDPDDDDTQTVYSSKSAHANMERLLGKQRASLVVAMLDNDPDSRPTADEVLRAFKE